MVQTLNTIPTGGVIIIEFADDSLQLNYPPSEPRCQTYNSIDNGRSLPCHTTTYDSGLIKTITIKDLCGSGTFCPPKQSLGFKVSDIRNPRSTKPIQNIFKVRTYTAEGFAIDKGSMSAKLPEDLTLEPASFSLVSLE